MTARRFQPPWSVLERAGSFCYRSLGGGAEKGSNTMSESDTALHDEEVLSDELPDAVLEVAGTKCWEGPASPLRLDFAQGQKPAPASRNTGPNNLRGNIAKLPELMRGP